MHRVEVGVLPGGPSLPRRVRGGVGRVSLRSGVGEREGKGVDPPGVNHYHGSYSLYWWNSRVKVSIYHRNVAVHGTMTHQCDFWCSNRGRTSKSAATPVCFPPHSTNYCRSVTDGEGNAAPEARGARRVRGEGGSSLYEEPK